MKRARAAAALCAVALALGCTAPALEPAGIAAAKLVQISEGRPAMGTVLEITLVGSDEAALRRAIERCFADAARLEMIFTTWREDGELARLNGRAGQGPERASAELVEILDDAQWFERATNGAFDVTVGPLVALWREAERTQEIPGASAIAASQGNVGAQRIRIDTRHGTIALAAGMSVDLGGLAKGWTLDRLGELLRDQGIDRSLLNFGGSSLRARGRPRDALTWRIAMENGEILELVDADVSISSSFGQSFEIAGEHFAHIIDPRTGNPIAEEMRTVVYARSGGFAEAWSTALVVLGAAGLDLLPCETSVAAHVITPRGAFANCTKSVEE